MSQTATSIPNEKTFYGQLVCTNIKPEGEQVTKVNIVLSRLHLFGQVTQAMSQSTFSYHIWHNPRLLRHQKYMSLHHLYRNKLWQSVYLNTQTLEGAIGGINHSIVVQDGSCPHEYFCFYSLVAELKKPAARHISNLNFCLIHMVALDMGDRESLNCPPS